MPSGRATIGQTHRRTGSPLEGIETAIVGFYTALRPGPAGQQVGHSPDLSFEFPKIDAAGSRNYRALLYESTDMSMGSVVTPPRPHHAHLHKLHTCPPYLLHP